MDHINLSVKCIFVNLLEDNIGENLDDLVYGDTFLDTTAKTCMKNKYERNI